MYWKGVLPSGVNSEFPFLAPLVHLILRPECFRYCSTRCYTTSTVVPLDLVHPSRQVER